MITGEYVKQKTFFASGATRDVGWRREQLEKLERAVRTHEQEIYDAVRADMNRPPVETLLLELAPFYDEIAHAKKRLAHWTREQKVSTPILLWPGSSTLYPEPRGVTMIISAWNFPFTQLLIPLVGAITSGCTAILRPSEMSPASSRTAHKLITSTFAQEYITVIEGGKEVTEALFEHPFDLVFFTGSPRVGSIIMGHASKHLTPVILELGGKSPAVVMSDADIPRASQRIAWSKYFNAGQICTATDHVYVHSSIKDAFVQEVARHIRAFYGDDARQSPDYGRILTVAHAERLQGLLDGAHVLYGGETDAAERYIAPTVVDGVGESHPLMQEEIFGPIMPVVAFEHIDEVIGAINARPKPLAFSLFTRDDVVIDRFLRDTSSGGITINDCMIHAGSTQLPFGGVGNSGMGAYHGKHTFDAFTHYKPVFRRGSLMDAQFRFPPFAGKLEQLTRMMRWMR